MPALRERAADIPSLLQHFLQRHQQRYGVTLPELSKPVLKALMEYHWPGNVRELSNRIERFVLLQDTEELLAGLNQTTAQTAPLNSSFILPTTGINFEQLEKSCLQQALQQSQGNRAQAARLLELPYKAFLYRLEKFGLN
jgi:DNA-binding NtrC family response regulator